MVVDTGRDYMLPSLYHVSSGHILLVNVDADDIIARASWFRWRRRRCLSARRSSAKSHLDIMCLILSQADDYQLCQPATSLLTELLVLCFPLEVVLPQELLQTLALV